MNHTAIPTPVPSVQELDAAWPAIKKRFDASRERVLDAAWQLAEYPSDRGYFEELEAAVEENKAADRAEMEFHQAMGAACRAEREACDAWLPNADRRAAWEVAS